MKRKCTKNMIHITVRQGHEDSNNFPSNVELLRLFWTPLYSSTYCLRFKITPTKQFLTNFEITKAILMGYPCTVFYILRRHWSNFSNRDFSIFTLNQLKFILNKLYSEYEVTQNVNSTPFPNFAKLNFSLFFSLFLLYYTQS